MMRLIASVVAVAALAGVVNAQVTYNDSINDLHAGANSNGNIDIKSVTVNHDASNLYFTIELRGEIGGANWGKYQILIDSVAGGRSDNPWGRNIGTGARLNDIFLGSWVDSGGGAQLFVDNGASWGGDLGASHDLSQAGIGKVTYTLSRALMNLTGDGTFYFDVTTTGGNGGDPGLDHLSNSGISSADWTGPNSTPGEYVAYTIPAPGAAALLGMGGLIMARRRRA